MFAHEPVASTVYGMSIPTRISLFLIPGCSVFVQKFADGKQGKR